MFESLLLFNSTTHTYTYAQPVNIDWTAAQEWYPFECLAQLESSQNDAFKQRFRHLYSNANKMMEYDRFNGINTLKWKKTVLTGSL